MRNNALIILIILIIASCSTKKNSIFKKSKEENVSIDRVAGYKYINPLLDCGMQFKEINPFVTKVKKYITEKTKNGDAKTISVYFRHLNNGYWFGINEKEEFNPASMMKVPIMMEFFKIAEMDPNVILNRLVFDKKVGVNNYSEADSLVFGKDYPILELVDRMIINSDNYASGLIYHFNRQYTDENAFFNETMINNNIEGRDPFGNITVKDYSGFFRILYNSSFLNKQMSETALALLIKTKFKNGLVKGVNNTSIEIAHKFGERLTDTEYQLHDCGIVYYPNEPYILCVMTRGHVGDNEKLENIISDISRIIYEEVNKQFGKK
ncbi:MAG: hypothetical protein A2X12_11350 [Bacteroidetes bacterium GWE2_29_8]|nr:MAG: hypothetical protein A2X12_11350 [Bacteroidetes bacterium GWE2_29_8]OFY23067.1 MAG: hypothetical protein A2X02_09565 [Bacteroidetes bacterium GWF2_29_10]